MEICANEEIKCGEDIEPESVQMQYAGNFLIDYKEYIMCMINTRF